MIDRRGLCRPLPVLRAGRTRADLAAGEMPGVVAADPGGGIDMAVLGQRRGHELRRRERRGGKRVRLFRQAERG